MARQLRIEYEGGLYHITSRGNQRGQAFQDGQDKDRFLTILKRMKER
jgi:putative transposase